MHQSLFWSQVLWIQTAQREGCTPQALGCKWGNPCFSHHSVTLFQGDFGSLLLHCCPSEAWLPSLHTWGRGCASSEGCRVSVHLCVCVYVCLWGAGAGEGGRQKARQPLRCHISELITHRAEGSSCRETFPPAPPRRQSRWKIGAGPPLGSGKKIFFFFPFSLKICSGLF